MQAFALKSWIGASLPLASDCTAIAQSAGLCVGSFAGLRGQPLTGTRFLSHWRFEAAGW
jgi:hypothetical protein